MAAFHGSSEVVDHLKGVRDLSWKQSQACGSAGPRFNDIQTDIRSLYCDLRDLEEKLANPKTFFKRCDHHTEVELRELLEECVEDLREIEDFINALPSQKRTSIKSLDGEVSELQKKIRDRRNSFQDFQNQATTTALETMKAQLYTLVDDILSKRRQPFILTKVVDWDALADELQRPVLVGRDMLEFDDGDSHSDDYGVIELPDSPAAGSPDPPDDATHNDETPRSRKIRYIQPTVEDYVEGEDDVFYSPATIPMSPRSSVTGVNVDALSTSIDPPENTHGQNPDGATEYDPLTDPKRKPRRVDTEMILMQEQKSTIKEEIRKLKEEAEVLEEQKRTWEAEQKMREEIQKFREFCSGFTKEAEEDILAECWRIPSSSFKKVTYFAMPSGTLYSAGTVQRRSSVPPTPPLQNAFRRDSYAPSGGSGRGSINENVSMASPDRRNSAIFGGFGGFSRGDASLDPYSRQKPVENGLGIGTAGGRTTRWDEDISASPREMSPLSGERTPTPSQPRPPPISTSGSPPVTPRRADIVQQPIEVSLEEVFNGTQRRVSIEREIFDRRTGTTRMEVKDITVPIKKGLKAGSKIKFFGVGNQGPDGVPQDIWFVVQDKAHHRFQRNGSDLHTTIAISLAESIVGWRKEVRTICGRVFKVKGPKNTPDGWNKTFHDFGLPRSSDPFTRGDLIVEVEIQGADHPGVA